MKRNVKTRGPKPHVRMALKSMVDDGKFKDLQDLSNKFYNMGLIEARVIYRIYTNKTLGSSTYTRICNDAEHFSWRY